jgi:HAD superfamily hydrolase (TIGR01450 family)
VSKSERPKIVLCDLDGVIWLAHQPIAGSVEAVARLRAEGIRVIFVTNNSFSRLSDHEDALRQIGISAVGDVITSAMSAAVPVRAGERILVCGGPGLVEAIEAKGATAVVAHEQPGAHGAFDAVVVGLHRQFSYTVLDDAQRAIRNGAQLIGSNEDSTYPTPQGPTPGGGAILAAIATAADTTAMVTGKPHQVMAELVYAMCTGVLPQHIMMVGDRPSTDGAFARTLQCRFALVLTGVTTPRGADVIDSLHGGLSDDFQFHESDIVGRDLASVVDQILEWA